MWNIMSANRILDIKWKKENQRKHLNTLRNIKSMINNLSPKKYSFLDSRPKTRQMKRCKWLNLYRKIILNLDS